MKKIKYLISGVLAVGSSLLMAPLALAANFPDIEPLSENFDIMRVLERVADWMFALAGALAVLFLIYGGIQYIIGGAKAEETAKKLIMNAIIGLIVIALAYVLAQLAIDLVTSTPK
ncbi:pilin [Patescibacteria group bacterium]|nr:pilin [Patescibacteria group bacterium]